MGNDSITVLKLNGDREILYKESQDWDAVPGGIVIKFGGATYVFYPYSRVIEIMSSSSVLVAKMSQA